MTTLCLTGCLVRAGRFENAVKRVPGVSSKYEEDDEIIALRNCAAHDGDVAADVSMLRFLQLYADAEGNLSRFKQIRGRFDQYCDLLDKQFGSSIAEWARIISSQNVVELLTIRSTVWGKKDRYGLSRSSFLQKCDQLMQKYKDVVLGGPSLDPFPKNEALAAEFERFKREAKQLLQA
jgi:hypothetical protein